MTIKTIARFLLPLLLLPGCGRKGPLYLEPLPQPAAPLNLTVRQMGAAVQLQWTLPAKLADDRSEMDAKRLGRTVIYMADKSWPAARFRDKAGELARLRPDELTPAPGGGFSARRELKAKDLADRPLYFAVAYEWGRRRSPLSAIVTLPARRPLPPVTDLKAAREGKVIVLRWSRPPAAASAVPSGSGASEASIPGFDVYRRIVGSEEDAPWLRINPAPLGDPYYEDRDTGRDGDYQYQVTVRLSDVVESAYSGPAAVAFRDTFAPDTPRNLVAFNGRDHVLLSWEKVADLDLAGYRVYRRGPQETEFRPLADTATDNFYRDLKVEKGKTYQYAVTALDNRKNESAPCAAVAQKFE